MSVTKNTLAPDAYIVGDILIDNAEQIAAKYNITDKYFVPLLNHSLTQIHIEGKIDKFLAQ